MKRDMLTFAGGPDDRDILKQATVAPKLSKNIVSHNF